MGFFDMPAGCGDADLEMAELERRGTIAHRRTKSFNAEELERLRSGELVETRRFNRDEQSWYYPLAKTVDEDECGMIVEYSMDGCASWHPTAAAARRALAASV